ncbi:uncharacterized protein LOC106412293 [Brassica napus]|uniref:uncharacterized protein LOC106412293 n=1 Tax=Brassica napus TaxID=3708 RepID=UPI0004EE06EE|nr:uncharacterized protein LOC106412293 [Brassica napus]XP_048620948.1 uncharacterized protein LOC106412293 [Brassica napus]
MFYILSSWPSRLFLNATLDIHFYFDNDCVASINYLKKVCGFDEGSSSAPTKYNGVKKIESIPLSELNSHVLTASPEAVEFICTAVVNGIETGNGWCYISCSKYYRKLKLGISAFTCHAYQDDNAMGIVSEMTRLTNVNVIHSSVSRRISANERGRPRHPRISTSPKPSISTSPNSTSHQNIRAPQRPASLIATSALLYLILTPTCV